MEQEEQSVTIQPSQKTDAIEDDKKNPNIEHFEELKQSEIIHESVQKVNDEVKVEDTTKESKPDQEEEKPENVLLDFSQMFKNGGNAKMPVLKTRKKVEKVAKNNDTSVNNENQEGQTQNQEEYKSKVVEEEVPKKSINEVPKNLTITQEEMKQRKFLDEKRWFCLSRPQYQRSCGISSLMSCWNYLFSTLGTGTLPPISVEEALQILGVEKEDKLFADTDFGTFTGNGTLIKWFKLLCKHFNVDGTSFYFWKVCGEYKTPGIDSNEALFQLEAGLRNENMTFIYHAHDHYFCPVGYEIVPRRPPDAYKKLEDIDPNELDHWIFIGEPSKRYPAFHIKPWEEISKDISMGNPQYYDIRNPQKGIMERKGEYYQKTVAGTSIHCIMAFQKIIKRKKVQAVAVGKKSASVGKKIDRNLVASQNKVEKDINTNENQEPNNEDDLNKIDLPQEEQEYYSNPNHEIENNHLEEKVIINQSEEIQEIKQQLEQCKDKGQAVQEDELNNQIKANDAQEVNEVEKQEINKVEKQEEKVNNEEVACGERCE